MQENVLIIFIKYPELGKVKTRLAKDVGEERACSLYRLFAEATLERTRSKTGAYVQVLFYALADTEAGMRAWLAGDWPLYPQEGDSLGDRIQNAFARVFADGARRAVIIGTDSPLLNEDRIVEAFHALADNDVVIGPALDGGYYLLGLSAPRKEIFSNIDWSSKQVCRQTAERIEQAQLSYKCLSTSFDIDDGTALRLLKSELLRIWSHDRRGLGKLREALRHWEI